MCDHCAKVTSQKGYTGQVTCRCDQEKKNDVVKERDYGGCCSKRAREVAGGCCMSGCCKLNKVEKNERNPESANCNKQMMKDEGCCYENSK
ncbi:hypothetical protein ACFW04_001096 [Cataglyphis niger]